MLELPEPRPRAEREERYADSNKCGGKHGPPLDPRWVRYCAYRRRSNHGLEVDVLWVDVNTGVVAVSEPDVRLGKKLVERAFPRSVC